MAFFNKEKLGKAKEMSRTLGRNLRKEILPTKEERVAKMKGQQDVLKERLKTAKLKTKIEKQEAKLGEARRFRYGGPGRMAKGPAGFGTGFEFDFKRSKDDKKKKKKPVNPYEKESFYHPDSMLGLGR